MTRTHKNVILNDLALEILDAMGGKSYSDKILLLYDRTKEFQDTHIKFKFAELKAIYPFMAEILDKNELLLCEMFSFLLELPEADQKKQAFIFSQGFEKLSKVVFKHMSQR